MSFSNIIQDVDANLPYVGLAHVQSNFGTLIEADEEVEGTVRLFSTGQILYGRLRPYLNKVHIAKQNGQCSTEFYVLSPNESASLLPSYLAAFLMSDVCLAQTIHMMTGNTHPRILREDFQNILIPIPDHPAQESLVFELNATRNSRLTKIDQANQLFLTLDSFLLSALSLVFPESVRPKFFALSLKSADDALNPERYQYRPIEKSIKGTTVSTVADILESKVAPSSISPNEHWDWIRIDDLSNQPLGVETLRTELGYAIDGTFYQVQENDILLARLGPTIQNAKFVLCPKLERQTVASSEFYVLRCRKGWDPLVVLWVLRTKLFRDLMYSKGRGGTPSRYRLSREDLAALPFPKISPKLQQELAAEISNRLAEITRLRDEADKEWSTAKQRFEQKLLGVPS